MLKRCEHLFVTCYDIYRKNSSRSTFDRLSNWAKNSSLGGGIADHPRPIHRSEIRWRHGRVGPLRVTLRSRDAGGNRRSPTHLASVLSLSVRCTYLSNLYAHLASICRKGRAPSPLFIYVRVSSNWNHLRDERHRTNKRIWNTGPDIRI